MITIKAVNLSKSFGNIHAVKNVNFAIHRGDVFGYLGNNGAGKTTTIRLILGLLRPHSGYSEILGHNSQELPREINRKVGVVLDTDGLYLQMSAEKNLQFYGQLYGLRCGLTKKIKEVLKFVDLYDWRHESVDKFSRGMQRKLALARALIIEPEVLICDELTTGLDPTYQQNVRNLVLKLAKENATTIFFSSHNLAEVQAICNKIGIIHKGELIAFGPKEELMRNISLKPRIICELMDAKDMKKVISKLSNAKYITSIKKLDVQKIQITLNHDDSFTYLIKDLGSANIKIRSINKEVVSLEDTYFKIVGGTDGK
jgi:ABC-2 type transport system ATP-binding protein